MKRYSPERDTPNSRQANPTSGAAVTKAGDPGAKFTEDDRIMSVINTNVGAMLAQRVLGMQNQGLNTSLERLSTGLRINGGSDDPAGLIASEQLRSEQVAINAAISNATRAEQVVATAEGGLQEINTLLLELQSLVGESANEAGISESEKEANQLQVDSILQTIDRIANSTSFNGDKLLNGALDYTTSGVDATEISALNIGSARLSDTSGSSIAVTVDVQTAATQGVVSIDVDDTGSSGTFYNNDGGSVTFEISGSGGVQQFTFASGTAIADMASAINTFSDALGVTAATNGTDGDFLDITANEYGSDDFVRVKMVEGSAVAGGHVYDAPAGTASDDLSVDGTDVVLNINGQQATGHGLDARVAADGFDVSLTIDATLNVAASTSSFSITGGGADFSLSPSVNLAGKVSLGIQTMTTGNLGDGSDFLSALKTGSSSNMVDGNLTTAQGIVESAISQVSGLRGRLGAFQKNTIGSTVSNLSVALENTAAAESSIRDTDFAIETAELTRMQILSQAATMALQIAKNQPSAVLSLLQ